MRRSRAEPLKTLIQKNLPPAFRIAMKLAEMERHWSLITGEALAQATRPVSLDRQGLVVLCATPAAAQMIRLSESSILSRLQKRWGLELKNLRPVVVHRLKKDTGFADQQPPVRTIKPNAEAVERHYHQNKEVIERSDVALALARLQSIYHQRFGTRRLRSDGKNRQEVPSKKGRDHDEKASHSVL